MTVRLRMSALTSVPVTLFLQTGSAMLQTVRMGDGDGFGRITRYSDNGLDSVTAKITPVKRRSRQ